VQLFVRITAIVNGEEIHLDDAWVFGSRIPADGVFRRISRLSFKQVAIVGVNAKIQCTNGAETEDCSHPTTTTEDIYSTDVTTPANTSSQDDDYQTTTRDTTTDDITTAITVETLATTAAQPDEPETTGSSRGTVAPATTYLGNTQNPDDLAMLQGGRLMLLNYKSILYWRK
jgi:hypothetical protein